MQVGHLARCIVMGLVLVLGCAGWAAEVPVADAGGSYEQMVRADGPVAYWRFEGGNKAVANVMGEALGGEVVGKVKLGQAGPRKADDGSGYTAFDADNQAAQFGGDGGRIVIRDTGGTSDLKFKTGDTITLEAWVNLRSIKGGQNVYVIGKGRTRDKGFTPENQNWALRLREQGSGAAISFLFRDVDNDTQDDYHRWTSTNSFAAGSGWHHIAVSYTFGKPESIHGYIDGKAVKGKWDMGGATEQGPVVDDDAVWIGSSMAGAPGSTFDGAIDEVAVYRKAIPGERMKGRYARLFVARATPPAELPREKVLVQVIENVPENTWEFDVPAATEQFTQDAFAFASLPRKYTETAVIADRSHPFLIRSWGYVELEPGEHQFMLRSLNASRLWIDGKVAATVRFMPPSAGGHGSVPDLPAVNVPGMRQMPAGHAEASTKFTSRGGVHLFMVETFVGGKKLRQEIGELSLNIASTDGMYYLLSPQRDFRVPLTDADWERYVVVHSERVAAVNAETRRVRGAAETAYWDKRHEMARAVVSKLPGATVPQVSSESAVFNDVDRFINARLEAKGIEPAPLLDDHAFLRRVTLDTVGVVPSVAEIEAFMADPPATRRAKAIDRLLADKRWADHWTSYFQDVLAENPGIIKPQQNNTGPFRWWIHESLLDNKPMDRFVTELVKMEGSLYYGGPAGFEMASQNDVPMAEKANVIGQAFLGVQMKCARCHDAPYHDVAQEDLFQLAAMLKRGPQEVPKTSSIPLSKDQIRKLLVNVTLEPGSKVEPGWPFAKWMDADLSKMPEGVVRDDKDTRDQLAALITWPTNQRFGRVMANRVWRRLMGLGIVEPVDDWETAKASHPELLDYLAREFVLSGYDLKHVNRLVLNSHAYQRQVVAGKSEPDDSMRSVYASPVRRRLSAEQVVDSLFHVAGKPLDSEPITMDIDGTQPLANNLNLGKPTRAWQFASLSNERDRPALSIPKAQAIIDVLKAFGWRENRAYPLTVRETTPTVQEPALLANGTVARWIARLSEGHAVTELALGEMTVEQMVDAVFLRVLSREATAQEKAQFGEYLRPGFERRIVSLADDAGPTTKRQLAVSWSNHLSPEATRIMLERERQAREGPDPTRRLESDWRGRMEDVVWALINSPEFVMMP